MSIQKQIPMLKFQIWAGHIKYKDWAFEIGDKNGTLYLQIKFLAPDNGNPDGPLEIQSCRKWMLSEHMTKSEFVQTAFKAVMTAEEHEIRETFKYLGVPVFAPHIDISQLHFFLASDDRTETRKAKT